MAMVADGFTRFSASETDMNRSPPNAPDHTA
jgi:hypothetical protein